MERRQYESLAFWARARVASRLVLAPIDTEETSRARAGRDDASAHTSRSALLKETAGIARQAA